MLEFNYWEVLEGNSDQHGKKNTYKFYLSIGVPRYIFHTKQDMLHAYGIVKDDDIYLEDYIEDLDNPTATELSLFELNTGIRLII